MRAQLRCTVRPGQFSAEVSVTVPSSHGKTFSLFAARGDVETESPPSDDRAVEGWLSVQVVKRGERHDLVLLPQSTLENGRYLSVRPDQLRGNTPHPSQRVAPSTTPRLKPGA